MTFAQQFKEEYKQEFMSTLAPQIEQQGRQEGRREGEYDKALVIAKKMLNRGENQDYIKEMTGLSDQELRCLEETCT
ncbi:RpnC/YadD family protein [Rickettsiella massiliensis]|uniref:hypothetical protein n=1 Tax=Rickettsiella massiliensis TaxID=676517 RepID=UPI000299D589|nr:hypothetical protein [Rickettsiella massiliensis]